MCYQRMVSDTVADSRGNIYKGLEGTILYAYAVSTNVLHEFKSSLNVLQGFRQLTLRRYPKLAPVQSDCREIHRWQLKYFLRFA
jgi:signal transduction histidine kinase